jgi:hypothetical protein
MPYITKLEHLVADSREETRKEWMTLTEATHYIREKESCELHVALRQLVLAIGDAEVQVKRSVLAPHSTLGRISASKFRGNLKICLEGDGSVKTDPNSERSSGLTIIIVSASVFCSDDDTAGEDELEYFPLLLRRSDVVRLWSGQAAAIDRQVRSTKVRNPPTSLSKIRKVTQTIYAEHSENPPNVNIAEKLIRKRLPGATRKQIRPILGEPEFAKLRPPRGYRPKR